MSIQSEYIDFLADNYLGATHRCLGVFVLTHCTFIHKHCHMKVCTHQFSQVKIT